MGENRAAVIGLDGLAQKDLLMHGFPGEWDPLAIETVAHTAPSWNAIFSGRDLGEEIQLYDFFKFPDDYDGEVAEMGSVSDEMWAYSDLPTEDHIWENQDVEVVSAPVVLPTFSTLDNPPGNDLTWCTEKEEFEKSMEILTEKTLEHEEVITVFPLPDKMNHMVDNRESPYTKGDMVGQMGTLKEKMQELTEAFDHWIVLSDHGKPSPREWVSDQLWVASHDPSGVIRSNTVDTQGYTNLTIHEQIRKLFEES